MVEFHSLASRGNAAGAAETLDQAADDERWFPLAPMQEAYIVGQSDAFQLGNLPCTAYFALDVGDVSPAKVEEAWNVLVRRHPALRIIFSLDHGQRILDQVPRVTFENMGAATVDEVRARFRDAPHDPAVWPLFHCAFTRSGGSTLIHLEINILVADGRSIQILLSELRQLCGGDAGHLAPVEFSFRDYCLRLSRQQARNAHRLADYWKERLEAPPESPGLPLASDPTTMRAQGCIRYSAMLSPDRWRSLSSEAAARGVSVNAVFLTSFALAVSRYSRHKCFPIGVTVFQRPEWHPAIDDVVGDFTGLLPFILDMLDPDLSFLDQAAVLQKSLWEDLANFGPTTTADLRAMLRARQTGGHGLPIVFTSLIGTSFDLGEWIIVGSQTETPQVWIDHQLVEVDGALFYFWEVATGLFEDRVVSELFSDHAERIERLSDGAGWTEPSPARQETATPASQARLGILPSWPEDWRDDAISVIDAGRSVTFAQLRTAVCSLAEAVGARTAPGERVGITLQKGWRQVVAALAVTAAGRTYVPLSADLPTARTSELIQTCAIRLVLTEDATGHSTGALPCATVLNIGEEVFDGHCRAPDASVGPEDLAYIIFTSGSTGKPKGVAIEHGAAHNTIADLNERLGLGPADRVLSLSSLSFDLSVFDIFGLIAAGGTVVLPSPDASRDPQAWALQCERAGVTVWNTVPALAEMLVEYLEGRPSEIPSGLRLFLLSGDWIPLTLPDRIRALWPHAEIVSLGGATEASIWSIYHRIEQVDPSWSSIPYGRALGGQTIDVYDDDLRRLPDGVVGEICIGGVGLAREYWADPVQTAARFPVARSGQRLYRTGDLGRRGTDGVIELLGREDGQVKINGFRIELGEVEAALLSCPGVTRCCAAVARKQLVAYVTTDPLIPTSEADQIGRLSELLPPYLVPNRIVQLSHMPLSANGKVDRKALPVPSEASDAPDGGRSDAIEQALCALAAEMTGAMSCQPDDDFFKLGGTSIQLIRFFRAVTDRYQVQCSLRDFAAQTRLRDIARLVRSSAAHPVAAARSLESGADPHEPFELLPVQQAYWIGRRSDLQLGGLAPHVYLELEADEFDVARAEAAWNILVARHPALRTVFTDDARQRVLAEVPDVRFETHDLRGKQREEVEAQRAALRARMSHEVFSPAAWPLFSHAVTIDDERARWHLSLDLLLGDAWSMIILANEFAVLYRDAEATLPSLDITFRDWVSYRRGLAASPVADAARDYWRRRIAALPRAPGLPMKDNGAAPRFERLSSQIDPFLWQALQRIAAERRLTAVNLLLGLFCETLRSGGGGDDFLLNVTFFNREEIHPDIGRLVGDFTSLLLLPVSWDPRAGLLANVEQLQLGLFEVMQHAAVSTVDIIRMAAPDRQISAPVVFTSTLGVGGEDLADGSAFPFAEVHSISQTPQVWLDHQLSEKDRGLAIVWDYRADLLDQTAMAALFEEFVANVTSIARGSRELDAEPEPREEPQRRSGPSEYMRLYRERPALRRDLREQMSLPGALAASDLIRARLSYRDFVPAAVDAAALGSLLSVLSDVSDPDRFVPKRAYGSAGSLYPVQIYAVVNRDLPGLEAATYYYNPDAHALARSGNRIAFDGTADIDADVTLILTASMQAIEPVYGSRARDFALIEAGLIAQTLESVAPRAGLGLCQVGWPPPPNWREGAGVDEQSEFLHGLVVGVPTGGVVPLRPVTPTVQPIYPLESEDGELAAVLLQALARVLGRSDVDERTNLFRAGGDSVAAVKANAIASEHLRQDLPLMALMENPTAASWAADLRARGISMCPA